MVHAFAQRTTCPIPMLISFCSSNAPIHLHIPPTTCTPPPPLPTCRPTERPPPLLPCTRRTHPPATSPTSPTADDHVHSWTDAAWEPYLDPTTTNTPTTTHTATTTATTTATPGMPALTNAATPATPATHATPGMPALATTATPTIPAAPDTTATATTPTAHACLPPCPHHAPSRTCLCPCPCLLLSPTAPGRLRLRS